MSFSKQSEQSVFLITSNVCQKPCYKAKKFLRDNHISYLSKNVKELSFEEIKKIIENISLDFVKGDNDLIQDRLFLEGWEDKYNINADIISFEDLAKIISIHREILRTPIAIVNNSGMEYSIIGYGNGYDWECLIQEDRDNIKWLVEKPLNTDREKLDWIINQFTMPNLAYVNSTKLYFPNTSILYGGEIQWSYPKNVIDKSGIIVKNVKKIFIKMQVKLGNLFKEVEYIINVSNRVENNSQTA